MTIELQLISSSDLEHLFLFQKEPDVVRMAAMAARTRPAFDALWEIMLQDPEVVARVIYWEGQLVGQIGSFIRHELREVGYLLAPQFWGKNITTQALQLFLRLDDFRPLSARIAVHNVASQRVVQKCGFVEVSRQLGQPGLQGEPVLEILFQTH